MDADYYKKAMDKNLLLHGFSLMPDNQPFKLYRRDSSPIIGNSHKGVNIPLTLCAIIGDPGVTNKTDLDVFLKDKWRICEHTLEPGKSKFSRMFQDNKLIYILIFANGLDASVKKLLESGDYQRSLPVLLIPIFIDVQNPQLFYPLDLYPPFARNSPGIMLILKDILSLFEKVVQPDLLLVPKYQDAIRACSFAAHDQRTKIIKDKYRSLQFVLWALHTLLFEEITQGNNQANIDVLVTAINSPSQGEEIAKAVQEQNLKKWLVMNELGEALADLIVPVTGGSGNALGAAQASHSMFIESMQKQRVKFVSQKLLSALAYCIKCKKVVEPAVG